jgi:tetratricopeptide (TPR) repeat protein
VSAWLAIVLLAVAAQTAPVAETSAAREEARQCLEQPRERAIEACRRALALPLRPARQAVVQRALALNLVAVGREDEALEVYREAARVRPDDADAQLRLGRALLSMAGDAEAALPALTRAVELRPEEPRAHGMLALALGARGRTAEAVGAFEAALRLDPEFFSSRPGARLVYEAARRGEAWPPPLKALPPPP